ncbi:MAG: hypothetical protein U1E38_00910 [Rhodospirillales bacterium]
MITVHTEADRHLDRSLQVIRSLGRQAGVSLNPATSETMIEHVLDRLDLILVMTVNPGFGGQAFIPSQLEKIRRIRAMIGRGPIAPHRGGRRHQRRDRAALVIEAGADVLVAGSAVFRGDDYRATIDALRPPWRPHRRLRGDGIPPAWGAFPRPVLHWRSPDLFS